MAQAIAHLAVAVAPHLLDPRQRQPHGHHGADFGLLVRHQAGDFEQRGVFGGQRPHLEIGMVEVAAGQFRIAGEELVDAPGAHVAHADAPQHAAAERAHLLVRTVLAGEGATGPVRRLFRRAAAVRRLCHVAPD